MRHHRDPAAGASRDGGGGEWTREPPDRTRGGEDGRAGGRGRSGRPVGSGAERQRYRAAPIDRPGDDRVPDGPPVMSAAHRRTWVAPRKVTTFRPGRDESGRFLILGRRRPPSRRPTKGRTAMTDPLSLTEVKRLAGSRRHDPPARDAHRRPRDAHRRLPAPRRRHDARLPARVRRGRRAPGPVQLPRRRPAPPAGGHGRPRPHDNAPGRRRGLRPGPARHRDAHAGPARGPPGIRPEAPGPPHGGDAPLHRRRGRRARLRGHLHLRAVRPAPGPGPRRRAARRLHRDRPRHRLRPPHPPALGHRLAPHRGPRPRGALPDRRARDLRGAGADRAPVGRRDGRVGPPERFRHRNRQPGRRRRRCRPGGPRPGRVETSLGRDQYIRAVETREGRDRGRRGDPGRPRAPPVVRAPDRSRTAGRSTASASIAPSAA